MSGQTDIYIPNCRLYLFWVYRACLDLQILLDFSHRVGSGREAWARHITNWRTVTTPLGLVASYCSSYHHIRICLLDAFCIMDPYFGHQLLYVHMTAMYIRPPSRMAVSRSYPGHFFTFREKEKSILIAVLSFAPFSFHLLCCISSNVARVPQGSPRFPKVPQGSGKKVLAQMFRH